MLPVERTRVMILEIDNILPVDKDTGAGTVESLHEQHIPSVAGHSPNTLIADCLNPEIFMFLCNSLSRFTDYSVTYSEINTLPEKLQLQQLQQLVIVAIEADYNWKIFILINGKCYIQFFLRPHLNRTAQTAINRIIE